jgi:hypothetical protein
VKLTRRAAIGVGAALLAAPPGPRGAAAAATATVRHPARGGRPQAPHSPFFARARRAFRTAFRRRRRCPLRAPGPLPLASSRASHRHRRDARRAPMRTRHRRRCAPPSCAAAACRLTRAPMIPWTCF